MLLPTLLCEKKIQIVTVLKKTGFKIVDVQKGLKPRQLSGPPLGYKDADVVVFKMKSTMVGSAEIF